jgi:hypothetical protein
MGSVDLIVGTFVGAAADKIKTSTIVSGVISTQQINLAASVDWVTTLNNLLNSSTGTGTKFAVNSLDVAILAGTDGRNFIAIDADDSGTFTYLDYLIEVTGSTLTGLVAGTFIN